MIKEITTTVPNVTVARKGTAVCFCNHGNEFSEWTFLMYASKTHQKVESWKFVSFFSRPKYFSIPEKITHLVEMYSRLLWIRECVCVLLAMVCCSSFHFISLSFAIVSNFFSTLVILFVHSAYGILLRYLIRLFSLLTEIFIRQCNIESKICETKWEWVWCVCEWVWALR